MDISMNFCFTVVTINYIKDSLLVRDSFLKHNPNWRFIIIVADIISDKKVIEEIIEYRKKGIEFLFFTEILSYCQDYPIDEVTTSYGGREISWSLKSFGFKYFFHLGYEKVLYVDSDMKFYNSVSDIWDKMEKYDAIITPHMLEPYPDDGLMQNNRIINKAGIANTGFVAIKNSPDGNKLVDFWMNIFKHRHNAEQNGEISDQPWVAWFPYLSKNILILQDKGYNVAYWNLHERKVSKKNGEWFADDRPLVFFHFSGLNKNNPEALSKYQNRYKLSDFSKDLEELIYDYIDDINSRSQCISAGNSVFHSCLPNTDFVLNESIMTKLRDIRKNNEISHISADIDSQLFISRKVADRSVKVNQKFGFDIAGCFFKDEESKKFLVKFLSLGIFFSIIEIDAFEHKKIDFLRPFYAKKTNNIGILFLLSDKSSSLLKKNIDFISEKSIKIIVVSDSYSGNDEDLRESICCFDRIITFSDKLFKRIEALAPNKVSLINNDSHNNEFIDSMYSFFSDSDIKQINNKNEFIYDISNIYDSYNSLLSSYKNLENSYKSLDDSYKSLDDSYKSLMSYYERLESSISYKIGRFFTYPISCLLKIFKK